MMTSEWMAGAVRPLVMLVAMVAVLGLVACSNTQKIPSKPMPAGVSYQGEWYSPQYENMTLTQSGGKVTGTFTYKGGGTLEGTLEGNVLHFEWIQPGDMARAQREVRGKGYFVIADDGQSFEGRWGYDGDNTGGGTWSAERLDTSGPKEDFSAPIFNPKN